MILNLTERMFGLNKYSFDIIMGAFKMYMIWDTVLDTVDMNVFLHCKKQNIMYIMFFF